jgi:hypothetical protein
MLDKPQADVFQYLTLTIKVTVKHVSLKHMKRMRSNGGQTDLHEFLHIKRQAHDCI